METLKTQKTCLKATRITCTIPPYDKEPSHTTDNPEYVSTARSRVSNRFLTHRLVPHWPTATFPPRTSRCMGKRCAESQRPTHLLGGGIASCRGLAWDRKVRNVAGRVSKIESPDGFSINFTFKVSTAS